MKEREKNKALDVNTEQYIQNVKRIQLLVLLVVAIAFVVFAHMVVSNNKNNLKRVALAEVQESMKETVNNIAIHIDVVHARTLEDAMVDIVDLKNHILLNGVNGTDDLLGYLEVCEKNKIGQVIEIIYTTNGSSYYINRCERQVFLLDGSKDAINRDAAICESFTVDGKEIDIFIRQSEIEKIVKAEVREHLHSETYSGNQYVWVNEVFTLDGGPNYAIRRIHPNLVESEGEYLSTYTQDVMGNYPYNTELKGIREDGYVFQSYYFKNKLNDEVTEKYSYAQYYEPFKWIIATGETLEEVYSYSEKMNQQSFDQIFVLMVMFVVLFSLTSRLMVKSLVNQSQNFRKTLLKQAEVYEDIYTAMEVGLLRIRFYEDTCEILQINPKALETLGVTSEEDLKEKICGHKLSTMLEEDAIKLEEASMSLKEQWESVVAECHVEWNDGSVRLIRIRDTLVDFDGKAKVIQRMCQDITEEHYQHEQAILKVEEKATLDPMTQIKNKRAIESIVRTKIMEAMNNMSPIAIGFMDIDNFRDYNTRYGHMQGDEVIKYVAGIIKEAVPGIVGRNGGDEFTFVIPNANYEIVEASMKVIYRKLNEGVTIKDTGEKIPTPCSIGVVIECSKELDYEYVMEQSDAAMYEAKARGKNTYYILDNTKEKT